MHSLLTPDFVEGLTLWYLFTFSCHIIRENGKISAFVQLSTTPASRDSYPRRLTRKMIANFSWSHIGVYCQVSWHDLDRLTHRTTLPLRNVSMLLFTTNSKHQNVSSSDPKTPWARREVNSAPHVNLNFLRLIAGHFCFTNLQPEIKEQSKSWKPLANRGGKCGILFF